LELRDVHLHGRTYTWSNERDNPTIVKLDHILVSVDWEELHPCCFFQALSTDDSDHCPLFLLGNASMRSKPRFDFEIFWPRFDGYLEAVATGWHCPDDVTSAYRRLDYKLRNVAKEL
jgi:hypothetical protein